MGVRPRPPPTATRKPMLPAASFQQQRADLRVPGRRRSLVAPRMAILEFARGRKANSGWMVLHCRIFCGFSAVRCDTSELVGGGVADAVAAGLNGDASAPVARSRMSVPDRFRPVVLDVLPRGEVGVTAVVLTGRRARTCAGGAGRQGRTGSPRPASARASARRDHSAGAADDIRPRKLADGRRSV